MAVPPGVLAAGALTVEFGHVVPMMPFPVLATVASFTIARTDMLLSRREAGTLLALYGLFVAWIVAEGVGAVGVVSA